ncbi:MAG: DUF1572 domain-containing protein [Eudoraea sp.]|uniref:DUF1572 domain-containing protein n=1 Tax=Eudoraea sp. TaxID=1979955 RepID=UPI003C77602C
MENSKQLAQRFKDVIIDGKWIANTNYKDQISGIDWEQATQKIGSLNSIALLTFHINYYIKGVLNVFEGGALEIRDKYSFDLSPITSEESWNNLRDDLFNNTETFFNHLKTMPDKKLEAPFVEEKYGSYRRNIEGMIEHSYYHLGQIVLIKKMLSEKNGGTS